MANKIIIPKAGYSALDDLDPDNIIFSSDYDTLKYDTLGETSLTVNFADYYHSESSGPFDIVYYHRKVVEVTHNLGYVPFLSAILWITRHQGKTVNCQSMRQIL